MHRPFHNTGKRRILIVMAIKLILIRHGESDGNVQRMFCGFKDVELTKKSHDQWAIIKIVKPSNPKA